MQAVAAIPKAPALNFVDDEAVNFIDNNLVGRNPSFKAIAANYEPAHNDYVLNQTNRTAAAKAEVENRQKSFDEAVNSYVNSKQASKLHLHFPAKSNWSEVLQEVDRTQEQYRGSGKDGILNSMRGKLRSFSENTQKVEQWLKMLPSDSWQGSLVCGGIKIVLQTARMLGKMREEVCDAIELIPELIASTQALEALYPGGAVLRAHAAELYIAILDVLELALSWYDRKPFLKVVSAMGKGIDYDRQFALVVQKLKFLEVRVDKQAWLHLHFGQVRTEQISNQNLQIGVETLSCLKTLLTDQQEIKIWQTENERLQREVNSLLTERERRLELVSAERKVSLLSILHYDRLSELEDLKATSTVDTTSFDDAQDRISYLLQRLEFSRWLSSMSSSLLIINGSEPEHTIASATSIFSAMVIRALNKSKQSGGVLMHWFCAQNREESIARMLRALLGQLLDQSSASMEPPPVDRVDRSGDVLDLLRLLGYCIKQQLRYSPVYCIVDAISFYEDRWRTRDLCYTFNRLAALTSADGYEHPLKILITSPTRAVEICESHAAADCVILDAEDEVGGSLLNLDEMDVLEHTRASLRRQPHRRKSRMWNA